ncbi:MAG: ATP phosphoribosyltransferase [Desulfobacterales bacterium]|nr:ATP phosphoribosyltransferase [Desulfobacterales bacterium]
MNFAIPDGHLMNHVVPVIDRAGLVFEGYEKSNMNRRPVMRTASDAAKACIREPGRVAAKVIRPQDMPTHVANANFDIGVSGTDWLAEHKQRFPNSPVSNRLGLGFGKVRIVVAVHVDHGDDIADFRRPLDAGGEVKHLKIASEYVYLADSYAHEKNLHPYRVIMTYGATESLIPEDCDMIVENTETGNTLRKNNLKIIDTLKILGSDESEACLVVSRESMQIPWKKELIDGIADLFARFI